MKALGSLVLQLLVLVVYAVQLDAVFKKDWVSYGFHFLESQVVSDHVLGLTPKNLLYNVTLSNHVVNYYIDLSLFNSSLFQVAGLYVVTYSSSDTKVSIHRASSGVYIDSVDVENGPISIKHTSTGLLIVLSANELYLWNEASIIPLGQLPSPELVVVEADDHTYIKSGNSFFNLIGYELHSLGESFQLPLVPESDEIHTLPVANVYSATGKLIIVPKPDSNEKIVRAHHFSSDLRSKSLIFRYLIRCKNHLVELGQYATNFWKLAAWQLPSRNEEYCISELLVFFDKEQSVLVAKEVSDGKILWTVNLPKDGDVMELVRRESELLVFFKTGFLILDLRDGSLISTESFNVRVDHIHVFQNGAESCIGLKTEADYRLLFCNSDLESSYLLESYNNQLQGYKVSNGKLVSTWKFGSEEEKLILFTRNSENLPRSVGIARYDRSVLYKFLDTNLVAIVTSLNQDLRLTLLDGVLGKTYLQQKICTEKLDFATVKMVQKDNWVVVSYSVAGTTSEQRITVLDLFSDSKMSEKSRISSFDSYAFNSTSKTFLFPERIVALGATDTRFGITTKFILALTESGKLVGIPKHVLNSRRTDDRKMTQEDFMDDFRMMPYQPLIAINPFNVLSHRRTLFTDGADRLLVQPANLESAAIVCLVNSLNEFCTIVQPSLSFDTLPASFQKIGLLMTLAALLVACVVSKPFVHVKELNNKWVD